MRISDWSSDVCSSDLASLYARVAKGYRPGGPNVIPIGSPPGTPLTFQPDTVTSYEIGFKGDAADRSASIEAALYHIRSEERRVGKGCVSKFRFRWSPSH